MIDLSKLVTELDIHELHKLHNKIKKELYNRSEEKKQQILLEQKQRIENIKHHKSLVKYISNELGYDITIKSRRNKYVMIRHALYVYFAEHELNKCTIVDIARIFNQCHSTIIQNRRTALKLKDTQHYDYIIAEGKVHQLINNFKNKNNAKQEFNEIVEPVSTKNHTY